MRGNGPVPKPSPRSRGTRADSPAREQLLNAALKVYAAAGTRGATTRRIAREAGVNEVTLFRQFGSKEALIRAAVSSTNAGVAVARLPEHPVDPVRELIEWGELHYRFLLGIRSFIRTGMGEFLERPEVIQQACQLPVKIANELHGYLVRLRADGLVASDWNARAATSMFMGTLFADAVQRDVMPSRYPYAQRDAVRHYVTLFVRALGLKRRESRHA